MKKILIIEDNFEVRDNLAEILELSNYNVITAENGKIGVQKALTSSPDIILCDVMMPELDGFGVLKILDKNPSTRNIPFIFLTAKAEKSDFRKGMNLGADDYITKPFDDVELIEAIERRLQKSERLNTTFDGTDAGLRSFIDMARGESAFEHLSEARELRLFRKKELIYSEDDMPKRLFFIAKGSVKTYKTNEAGKEFIHHIYQAGEFFGYYALLSGMEYSESAAALEDSEISFIPKEDFFTLLHNNRDFAARFIKMLAVNSIEQEEQLINLAYNSIKRRLANVLLKLYQQAEGKPFNILREDLASMVGTAKESVIRALTELKNEDILEVKNHQITILDAASLISISG